jgi:hypothetical protein
MVKPHWDCGMDGISLLAFSDGIGYASKLGDLIKRPLEDTANLLGLDGVGQMTVSKSGIAKSM